MATGDQNTKYFHSSIVNRRRRNKIMAIFDKGIWVKNRLEINMYFMNNFEEVYTTDKPSLPEPLGALGFQSISGA